MRLPSATRLFCPGKRLEPLRQAFGSRLREVVVPGRKHSVLTVHFESLSAAEQARVRGELASFLSAQLRGPA